MPDADPDINKISAYFALELLKSSFKSIWNTSKKLLVAALWPTRWLWKITGLELRRKPRLDGQLEHGIISDNVLWTVTSTFTYSNSPGELQIVVDGPLCPTHLSPLWFGMLSDEEIRMGEPVTESNYVDEPSYHPLLLQKILYCPDDDEVFRAERSQNVGNMRTLAESKLRGKINRAQMNQ